MSTPTYADAAGRLVEIVMRRWDEIPGEPTPAECPTWCVLRDLEAAGNPADPEDPFCDAAFWEYVAWASEQLFGPEADAFAQTCRAIADDCVAGIAV